MDDLHITALIPHRPPFLLVDRIIESSSESIICEKIFPENLDIFSGHYPGNPIVPGVLLCEAIFQTGALLIATMLKDSDNWQNAKIPVLTKISGARFKRLVRPGETVTMTVKLLQTVSSVCVFKGVARVNDELSVKTEFSCALVDP